MKKNGNIRYKRRAYKNLFWLVRHTLRGSRSLILYNREPQKLDWSRSEYADEYNEKFIWISSHDQSYLGAKSYSKFSDVTWRKPIKVRLVLSHDSDPDMYIQRVGENLFIDCMIMEYSKWGGNDYYKVKEIKHCFRISNKLFPEVTEKMGIVSVKIERI